MQQHKQPTPDLASANQVRHVNQVNGRPAVKAFDEHKTLHDLAHYLPSQGPLKDFIHHNSLHAFQDLSFYDAIFQASKIFGYKATLHLNEYRKLYGSGRISADTIERVIKARKGAAQISEWTERMLSRPYDCSFDPLIGRLRARWKTDYHFDIDNRVQPLLFRILCSYLDQGIALQHFPFETDGLLAALRQIEQGSYGSFFQTKRARRMLMDEQCNLGELLRLIVGEERFFRQYLFDQQFSHRGWSGLIAAVEAAPHGLLYRKNVGLHDLILLDLLLELDALDAEWGENGWKPLCTGLKAEPMDYFADYTMSETDEILSLWQDAFEWSYYDEVLSGVRKSWEKRRSNPVNKHTAKTFQAIFCIDERECSLRRHIEHVDKNSETFGCPGFFGVEFFFQPEGGKFYEKLCPAPVTPKYLIKEYGAADERSHPVLYTKKTHTFVEGFFLSLSLGVLAAGKMFLDLFRPKMNPAISDAFAHMSLHGKLLIENTDPSVRENDLQVGFTVPEMAARVEGLLRGIGLAEGFAPLVYVVAHGSSSANNPHHGAHDCGACSGRPGATNARVFAFMANHSGVRALLSEKGLHIPSNVQFVGAMHDTAADVMGYYDTDVLNEQNAALHQACVRAFEDALDLNAKERSRRFASINTKDDIKRIREAIRKRSVSMFEPRPELGHGTNALCFVGNRALTKGLFLDRRAFMNSYDYRTDPDGKLLLGVIRPLPPVCGGINLEYYFSRVDNQKLGAGTKLPHNVMGLIGVANSSDGDLRPGLPWQMVEPHDPVRLLIAVEHYPEVVLKTVQSEASLYEWFERDWVHLMAIHPDTNEFFYFRGGVFEPYKPFLRDIHTVHNLDELLASAEEMETNHIMHATKENIPIHLID